MTSVLFSKDAREFIRCLSARRVRFILVGGIAVVYHGYPRLTGDFDFFFEPSRENAGRLFKALGDFWGGDIPNVDGVKDLQIKGLVVQFGVVPNRIDLVNSLTGVSFAEAWKSRITETIVLEGKKHRLAIIGLAALIKNKRAVGRPRDLDDANRLLKAAEGRRKQKA